jgi:hypothetical protein
MRPLLVLALLLAACASSNKTSTTNTTSAPASHATAWTTSGGPANAGSPAMGTVTDPGITPVHDGGVW